MKSVLMRLLTICNLIGIITHKSSCQTSHCPHHHQPYKESSSRQTQNEQQKQQLSTHSFILILLFFPSYPLNVRVFGMCVCIWYVAWHTIRTHCLRAFSPYSRRSLSIWCSDIATWDRYSIKYIFIYGNRSVSIAHLCGLWWQ